ncbi:MAG TPA: hypothetical protein VFM21_07525 [Terriglobia bacterium]|nr:hypothetical protein [Terriglobia bacterium]
MSASLVELLKACEFDVAIRLADQMLREAANSPEHMTGAAREIVAWKGIFRKSKEAAASETYFRAVHSLLAELAGPESTSAMAAPENLDGILGSLDKVDEAIHMREKFSTMLAFIFLLTIQGLYRSVTTSWDLIPQTPARR